MTSLELTDQEKNLFISWLQQREKSIQEEMELLKSLRKKIDGKSDVSKSVPQLKMENIRKQETSLSKDYESSSWIDVVKRELEFFSISVPSGEIVKRLMENPTLALKGKRFVTKAVTSKLWLLQERGEVIKSRDKGRYVYALKK